MRLLVLAVIVSGAIVACGSKFHHKQGRRTSSTGGPGACNVTRRQSEDLECGITAHRDFVPRIIGGRDTAPGEFPFVARLMIDLASLVDQAEMLCSGVILDKWHILTAGHCLKDLDPNRAFRAHRARAEVGGHPLNSPDRQIVQVARAVVHKEYAADLDHKIMFDIAMLKLETPLEFGIMRGGFGSVNRVCLPADKNDAPDQHETLTAIGWGLVEKEPPRYADTLQAQRLRIMDKNDVMQYYGKYLDFVGMERFVLGILDYGLFLTRVDDDESSVCFGDSGGPAVRLVDGQYQVVGLVSHGEDNSCEIGAPVVFTRVSELLSWIEHAKETLNARSYGFLLEA